MPFAIKMLDDIYMINNIHSYCQVGVIIIIFVPFVYFVNETFVDFIYL